MEHCKHCNRLIGISPAGRERIRVFRKVYPWITQKDLAVLFNVTQARMSEIIRKDKARGGN